MQSVWQAFLKRVEMNGKPFVLRGLQRAGDRLDLAEAKGDQAKLRLVVATMGKITAWGQLRGSGWQSAVQPGELTAFGHAVDTWRPALVELAEHFAKRVEADSHAFRDDRPKMRGERKG